MKRLFTLVISIVMILVSSGCNPFECRYNFNLNRLKSSCGYTNLFKISKLNVLSLNEEGFPKEYDESYQVRLVKNSYFDKEEYASKLASEDYSNYMKLKSIRDSLTNKMIRESDFVEGNSLAEKFPSEYKLEVSTQEMMKEIENQYFPFKKRKTIRFDRRNKYYKWVDGAFSSRKKTYDFPIKYNTNEWYMIGQLSGDGSGAWDYTIFFYVDKKGKLNQFHKYKPGPW